MESHYRYEGEMVVADILFVPTRQAELLTCAATNEAVSTPVKQTVQVDVKTTTTTTTTTTSTTTSITTSTTTTTTTKTTTKTTTSTTTTGRNTTTTSESVSANAASAVVDYYDYSHFDDVNDIMNTSFVATVLEKGEKEYLEILFNPELAQPDYNDVEDQEYLEQESVDNKNLSIENPGAEDAENVGNSEKSANTPLTAGGHEGVETGTKEAFVKPPSLRHPIDEKLDRSPVSNTEHKKREKGKKGENETLFKESPLTMNSAVTMGSNIPLLLLLLLLPSMCRARYYSLEK